jgi:hypothetical protein
VPPVIAVMSLIPASRGIVKPPDFGNVAALRYLFH